MTLRVTEYELKAGSVQLRIIKSQDSHKGFPDYVLHTVLEPLSDDLCELKGLTDEINAKRLRLLFDVCKKRGFKVCRISRACKDGLNLKIKDYTL